MPAPKKTEIFLKFRKKNTKKEENEIQDQRTIPRCDLLTKIKLNFKSVSFHIRMPMISIVSYGIEMKTFFKKEKKKKKKSMV